MGIRPTEVRERFVLGAGPGGQKINKTASTVMLRHLPTGTEVRCQKERSRSANRALAWETLCEKLERARQQLRSQRRAEIEKQRRRNRPKSRAQKRRMVADKRHRSQIKSGRGKVRDE
ncbi:MAG: peptide chain release factor-like protein [Synoicihabitans sp.]